MTGIIEIDKANRKKAEMLASIYMGKTDKLSASSTPEEYVAVYNEAISRIISLLESKQQND